MPTGIKQNPLILRFFGKESNFFKHIVFIILREFTKVRGNYYGKHRWNTGNRRTF